MKSILITGATGFYGNAMVRRLLAEDEYTRICIFSRDEAKQAAMRVKFNDDSRLRWFVGCVRDKERLTRAMRHVDVVVHAAALKRIEVGFYNPEEMVKTNVVGTMNMVDAAASAAVEKVVMLSTDKAYQPVSAYGQSKAIAESIVLAANNTYGATGPVYSVVRYGNVAGSTGSVIPIWRETLKKSDTVIVTDPDCTRFWMTADDAVDLVMDTINWDQRETKPFIPTLPAYRLGDLAEAMGAKMNITGLPAWEKRAESMEDGKCSADARRMTVDELKLELSFL
jgi:UDP-N-acetylglucosamine 4,6-dehydratase